MVPGWVPWATRGLWMGPQVIDPTCVSIAENDQRVKLRRLTWFAVVDVHFQNFDSYIYIYIYMCVCVCAYVTLTFGRLYALKASYLW